MIGAVVQADPPSCSVPLIPSSPERQPTDAELRRERIDKLVDAARRTLPHWAKLPPWLAETYLEGGAVVRTQTVLPFGEGGNNG